jgi:glycosyltransferase involved in cell wall biosynthesis
MIDKRETSQERGADMKIDMHCHSDASKRPAVWLLRKIGCAESYTEADELYRILRRRGMDAVTITDHNSIDGCLEIGHLSDTFISCEVTTYFPDDRCKLHVLVYRITETQFREIDRLRENVFDFVAYLAGEGIAHSLAHPLFSVNGRISVDHFERCMLLFRTFELNGDQEERSNDFLKAVLTSLDSSVIERLVERHGIVPRHAEPWKKTFTGGSDDHSGLNAGKVFTEVAGAATIDAFFDGVDAGASEASFLQRGAPGLMAHHIYSIAYQYYKRRFAAAEGARSNDLTTFLDRVLMSRDSGRSRHGKLRRLSANLKYRKSLENADPRLRPSIFSMLQGEAYKQIEKDPQLSAVIAQRHPEVCESSVTMFHFINRVNNKMLEGVSRGTIEQLFGANFFDLFHSIGSVGALYALTAPYFISYSIYGDTRRFIRALDARYGDRFGHGDPEPNVAVFTDTFDEINGVSLTLRKQAALAHRTGKQMTVVTCAYNRARAIDLPSVRYFDPLVVHDCPEYPEQKLFVPPLLEIVDYCHRQGFTHVHAATPGTMGLCALAIARTMKLPFLATYHTSVPQYALHLTADSGMEDIMWRYITWFYNQADAILAPSRYTAAELVRHGIPEEKLRIMPRGVDVERFRRDAGLRAPGLPEGKKLLYVGRVSKEKNMPLLCDVFKRLHEITPDVHLIVVGDGPYLGEMKEALEDYPCLFTGYREGAELVAIYNSCDLFVFPSSTDTFGNVVLEAQACGLPVVVTDVGGQVEIMSSGATGIIAAKDSRASFLNSILAILRDEELRARMSRNSRAFVQQMTFEKAFEESWGFYDLNDRFDGKRGFGREPAGYSSFELSFS